MNKLSKLQTMSLFVFLFTFSLSFVKAQSLAPFPAIELGQSISITESDPSWTPLWQAANASRVYAQTQIANGQSPLNQVSCVGNVCCETLEFWNFNCKCWVFVTRCKVDGVELTPIVMYE